MQTAKVTPIKASILLVEFGGHNVVVDVAALTAVVLPGENIQAIAAAPAPRVIQVLEHAPKPQEAPIEVPQPETKVRSTRARAFSASRTVLATLREFGDLTTHELVLHTRRDTKQINDALNHLVESGMITNLGIRRHTEGFPRSSFVWRANPQDEIHRKGSSTKRVAPGEPRKASAPVLGALSDKAMTTRELQDVLSGDFPRGTVSGELHRLFAEGAVDKVITPTKEGVIALWSRRDHTNGHKKA